MVLPTAIHSSAVKVALVMMPLSSKMLAKNDRDQRLGLQQPADEGSFARTPFEDLAGE